MSKQSRIFGILAIAIALLPALAWADAWDQWGDYYDDVDLSGDGDDLKESLTAVMSFEHTERTYGDFRFSAALSDQDPEDANRILLVYNRVSVPATWNNGTTWNREHTWPDSHQPGNADNEDIGAIADPHMLRPCNPTINGSRGNKPYGLDSSTGTHGAVSGGIYYFPGDADKGDMARTFFYADTRWTSEGFSLVDSVPGGYQMGDRSSLINWHYLDVPDEFERRRNHVIYSQALNPTYYTNNRNAYVDNPEYVWSVYMDQQNDSQITISGGTPVGNGGSVRNVDFGRAFVGGAVPAAQNFNIVETGDDGTYFSVTATEGVTSSINGKYNAFAMNAVGNRSITVGIDPEDATVAAGLVSGTVTVDNLDVTDEFGTGHGELDDDDVFNVSFAVVDHATPSWDGMTQETELMYDFGNIALGAADPIFDFDLFNLESTLGFTADLDFDNLLTGGDTDVFSSDLAAAEGSLSLDGGDSQGFTVTFDTASVGSFSATYTLLVSDEDLTGALNDFLTLTVSGQIVGGGPLLGDYNGNDALDAADYTVWRDTLDAAGTELLNDPTPGVVDDSDFEYWRDNFGLSLGGGAGSGSVAAVPEPASLFLLLAGGIGMTLSARRRIRRAG